MIEPIALWIGYIVLGAVAVILAMVVPFLAYIGAVFLWSIRDFKINW